MCSCPNTNTCRVTRSTPRVDTCRVQYESMDTIGERIKKARLARGWSGQELARRAGYKTQSGISNLENRSTGSGGHRVAHIAQVLRVPIEWILNGGDSDVVPLLSLYDEHQQPPPLQAREPNAAVIKFRAGEDARTVRLFKLWAGLDDKSKDELLGRVEFYVAGRAPHTDGQALSVANNRK